MYHSYIKRLLDITCALLGLTILSPLLLMVAVMMPFANKGAGVFFFQARPGRRERFFDMYEFKSMTDERDAVGNLLPDAQYPTAIGRFIHKTFTDELPQLWNVLRGDMSLMGPRPLLATYRHIPTEHKKADIISASIEGDSIAITPTQRVRHQVRPGITGLAQINGRNKLSYQHHFVYDAWYVHHLFFALDLKTLLKTVTQTL